MRANVASLLSAGRRVGGPQLSTLMGKGGKNHHGRSEPPQFGKKNGYE
jgi:hypothetical protein